MLRKLMDEYPLSDFLVAGIDTCSELVLASGVGGEQLVQLLVERLRSDPRPALKCAAVRALTRLLDGDARVEPERAAATHDAHELSSQAQRSQLSAGLEPLVSYAEHLHDVYWTPTPTRQTRDLSALPALVAHVLRVLDGALPALDERSAAALLHLCATRLLARPDTERAATAEATTLLPVEQLGLFHQRAAALHLLAHCFLPAYSKLRASLPSVDD